MKAAEVKVKKQIYKGELKAKNKAHKLNMKFLKQIHKTEVTAIGKGLQVSRMSSKNHHYLYVSPFHSSPLFFCHHTLGHRKSGRAQQKRG